MTNVEGPQTGVPAARAGTQALSILSLPLNTAIVKALAAKPKPLADLRRGVDSPPQSTMRSYLRTLSKVGVVERHSKDDFPGIVEYQLADGGRELMAVADILSAWLAKSPEESIPLGSGAARSAVKALLDGWLTNIVRALADYPRSLIELDAIITSVS